MRLQLAIWVRRRGDVDSAALDELRLKKGYGRGRGGLRLKEESISTFSTSVAGSDFNMGR